MWMILSIKFSIGDGAGHTDYAEQQHKRKDPCNDNLFHFFSFLWGLDVGCGKWVMNGFFGTSLLHESWTRIIRKRI